MYNRTHQLQSLAEGFKVSSKYRKDCIIVVEDGGSVPMTQVAAEDSDEENFGDDFKSYLKEIEEVRELIKGIDKGANDINDLLEESDRAVTSEQTASVSARLNELVVKTNELCTKCKALTNELGNNKDKGTPTEARMRNNAHNVCLKHFQAAMGRYQDSQVCFKKSMKERTSRQIQLIYPEVQKEELEQIMKPGTSRSVLEYAARSSIVGNTSITDAVDSIQSKYNDVLALEESVEELHQMMVELAGLVSYQGDLIDQVEHNAMKAVEYTEKATAELVKAKRNKRRASKLIMYFTIGATLAGIAVIIPVVLKLA